MFRRLSDSGFNRFEGQISGNFWSDSPATFSQFLGDLTISSG